MLYQTVNSSDINTTPTLFSGYPFENSTNLSSWTGYYGFKFNTGSSPMVVTGLGRYKISGNKYPHRVILQRCLPSPLDDFQSGSYLTTDNNVRSEIVASAIVQNVGAASTFNYAMLEQPVVLDANTYYYLASYENCTGSGGETFISYSTNMPANNYTNGAIWGIVESSGSGLHAWASNPLNEPMNVIANVNLIMQ
jgi:hypothetical protein